MRHENLLVLIELEALITERAGMEAENAERKHHGYSVAYGMASFEGLEARISELRVKVKEEPKP